MQSGMLVAGRYQIESLIGQGGMGAVYRGQDAQTGQTVAIKRLKPELVSADSDLLERFSREGQALRELNHPNIVKILDAVQDANGHYLIMEYVGGGSLADLLGANQALAIPRVLDIALELADALTRAHHLKIIHRDIKPANVLLADDGTPRLSDFGVALMSADQRLTGSGVLIGTPEYLSPEMLNGEDIDPRADLWAFGVLLFEMLTGQRPFTAPTMGGIITAILTKATPDLEALRPDIPVALADLVYRMLEKDRQQRIPSARLVGAELEALIQGRDTPSQRKPAETLHFETPPDTVKPRHNLPLQTTAFVGREQELTELAKLLDHRNVRLVTILAPGGMGKTRLALETADRMLNAPSFTNGVYFVALAPVNSPDFIVSATAEAVGFQFYPGGEPQQELLDYFRQKRLLLVMDNFEHLLDGASLVSEILAYAPGVKILTTSRERLNLSGETIFALSGMDFPDWETPKDALDYAAVKLFMQSARRARPDFELTGDDLTYLARICRLVAGMPLGIVLAAAWLEALSLDEIASEIAQSLDFLETTLRDVPERQRSLRAVFEYSWNRLSDGERDAFMKLSVFRGGFTREAALAVVGASLKTLTTLVNKALLRRDPGSGRYEVHELLRQLAEQQLDKVQAESDEIHDTHCRYYADFMRQREADLKGRRQVGALTEIEVEFANVRAAWDWAVKSKNYQAVNPSLDSLCLFCDMRSRFQEGKELFWRAQEILAADPQDEALWGRVWLRWVEMWRLQGHIAEQYEDIKTQVERSLAIARKQADQAEMAFCLWTLGILAYNADDNTGALAPFEASLALYSDLDDPFYRARVADFLAASCGNLGQYDRYMTLTRQSLDLRRRIGDQFGSASSLNNLRGEAYNTGKYTEAKSYVREWRQSTLRPAARPGWHGISCLGRESLLTKGILKKPERWPKRRRSLRPQHALAVNGTG